MFFILSKILLFLISPTFWIVLLFVWSFITKKEKRKKRLRIASLVLFIIFSNPFLYNVCLNAWQPAGVDLPKDKKYSAAILLSGMMATDRYNRSYFTAEGDRFIQTTKLYHTGVVDHIAISGGSGALIAKGPMEADDVKKEMLMQGVPDSVIIIDNASRNTYENAVFTKKIFDSLKIPPPYILVTSAMHMPRAKAAFNKAGMEVTIFPAAYKQVPSKRSWDDFIIPSPGILNGWNFFMKEVVGLMVYRWTGKA